MRLRTMWVSALGLTLAASVVACGGGSKETSAPAESAAAGAIYCGTTAIPNRMTVPPFRPTAWGNRLFRSMAGHLRVGLDRILDISGKSGGSRLQNRRITF